MLSKLEVHIYFPDYLVALPLNRMTWIKPFWVSSHNLLTIAGILAHSSEQNQVTFSKRKFSKGGNQSFVATQH